MSGYTPWIRSDTLFVHGTGEEWVGECVRAHCCGANSVNHNGR